MGYQERKAGHWMKPVGYHSFTFHEDRNEWANWFLAATGKIMCMESHKLDEAGGDFLSALKSWECYTKHDVYSLSSFEMVPVYDI